MGKLKLPNPRMMDVAVPTNVRGGGLIRSETRGQGVVKPTPLPRAFAER